MATWDGVTGSEIKDEMKVVISRTHPKIDSLSYKSYTVANKGRLRMELHGKSSTTKIDEDTKWRLDIEVNYIPLYRVNDAIQRFTHVPEPSSPSVLQVLLASYEGNAEQRRAMNTNTNQVLPTNKEAFAHLNVMQRNAAEQSFTQRVNLIQGSPGTGKT